MKDGFTAFTDMMDGSMKGIVTANGTTPVEMGRINSDLSLTTDSFPIPIPKGDYMVNVSLTHNSGIEISEENDHTHTATTRTLSAGDRVVVARVGKERVVMAIVVSSNKL